MPAEGYVGSDSFEYTVRDGGGATADGLVTVEVARRNAPPVAVADSAATSGQPVTIDLLANDNDPDADPLRLTALTLPVAGQIALNPQGGVTYTPAAGFVGTDGFTYEISDGTAVAEGEVTVTVTEPIIPAYANRFRYRRRLALPPQPDATETAQDFVFLVRETGDWLCSVSNGGRLESAQGFDLPFELTDGTKLDHEIERYDPVAGALIAWVRLPSWQFTARLDLLLYYGKSALTATEANPAGVWRGYLAVWDARTGADRTGNGRTLMPSGIGVGSLIGDCGSFNGTAVASLASANWLNNNPAITVQALTRADAAMIGSNHGVLAQGIMNGTDASAGLGLQYLASNAGATNVVHFKVRCTDGATYVMSAGGAHSDRRLLVHGVWKQGSAPSIYLNGALSPASASDVPRGGTTQIATGGLYLGAGARDPATGGWAGLIDEVRIAGAARSAAWIATEYANLVEDQLFYGLGGEDRPTDLNAAPLALPAVVTTPAGINVDMDLLAGSDDTDSSASLTVVDISAPAHGVATVVAGRARYTPTAGYVGRDGFSYTVSDGAKRSSALVSVDVTVPVLRAVDDSASAISGQAQTIRVLANDQGASLAVVAVSDPPHGTAVLNPDSSITYRSDAGYTGSDSFNYTISDGLSQATAQVAVTVTAASSGVQLPSWPVSYTGATYFVSAAGPAGNALSQSRTNPGAAQHALNNAPSLSTIVFLGAGPYPTLALNRSTTTHLKLISDAPAFIDLVNLRPASLTAAQLNTLEDSVVIGKNLTQSARLGNLTLQQGGYLWIEGFRSEFPATWTMSATNGGSTASMRWHLVDQELSMARRRLQPAARAASGQRCQPAQRRPQVLLHFNQRDRRPKDRWRHLAVGFGRRRRRHCRNRLRHPTAPEHRLGAGAGMLRPDARQSYVLDEARDGNKHAVIEEPGRGLPVRELEQDVYQEKHRA